MERLVKYIVVPIEIWEDRELSWGEKALLIEIDSYTRRGKPCFISNEFIANLLNVTETNASKALGRLIKKGYVRVVSFDGRHRYIESCVEIGLSPATRQGCHDSQVCGCDTSNISTNKENTISEEGSLFGGGEEANCPEKPKVTSQTTTKNNEANRPAATLEEREARFSEECRAFTAEFGNSLIEDFILYWTEPNKSRSKMRFEQQTTWDTHRRLLTWKRNNFNKYDRIEAQPREEHYLTAEEIDRVMNWRRDD